MCSIIPFLFSLILMLIFIIPICLVSTQGTKNVLGAARFPTIALVSTVLWSHSWHHLVLFRSISLSIFVFQASMKIVVPLSNRFVLRISFAVFSSPQVTKRWLLLVL